MSQFEYVAVLVSVIAGLGIVHLLGGVAGFVVSGSRRKPYWVHLLWTWNVFHFVVYYWWFVWRWSAIDEWRLLLYLFLLLYGVCLYLLCAILYPSDAKPEAAADRIDYRKIYYQNARPFFLMWTITIFVDIADTILKARMGLEDLSTTLIPIWTLLIVGSLAAARVARPAYHVAWAIVFFGVMAYVELSNFGVLRSS